METLLILSLKPHHTLAVEKKAAEYRLNWEIISRFIGDK